MIFAGDLNAHDPAWDSHARADSRGGNLIETIIDEDGIVVNDGSHTRIDTAGNKSTPDLTIVHSTLADKCNDWKTHDKLISDHLPITFNLLLKQDSKQSRTQMRWNWKKADWDSFTDNIDGSLPVYSKAFSVTQNYAIFKAVVLRTAHATIGKIKVGQHTNKWADAEIQQAIEQRDAIRTNSGTTRSRNG